MLSVMQDFAPTETCLSFPVTFYHSERDSEQLKLMVVGVMSDMSPFSMWS